MSVTSHSARMLQVATGAAASEAVSDADKLKGPPNLLWRVASAMMYLIPWIDTIAIGREIYHNFPVSLFVYFLPGALLALEAAPSGSHLLSVFTSLAYYARTLLSPNMPSMLESVRRGLHDV